MSEVTKSPRPTFHRCEISRVIESPNITFITEKLITRLQLTNKNLLSEMDNLRRALLLSEEARKDLVKTNERQRIELEKTITELGTLSPFLVGIRCLPGKQTFSGQVPYHDTYAHT